jgi:hypothetical protein
LLHEADGVGQTLLVYVIDAVKVVIGVKVAKGVV